MNTFEIVKINITSSQTPVKKPPPRVPPVIQTTTAVGPTQRPGPSPDPGFDPDPDPSPSLNPNSAIRPEHELQSEAPHRSSQTGSLLFVALAVAGVLLLVSAALVVFYCKKRVNRPQDVNTGVQQIAAAGDCTYQSLNMDSMDPDQTYSTLCVQQGAPQHAQEQQQIVAAGDCTYQNLNLISIDPNQTYSTLCVQQRATDI
ncbi:uncharacterized protein LOC129411981 [Boleophthalmus pectinirostris]|uniref:uncharacterized protein LOC129411981 n=1 Tax=Boleophthalmus pectinirostris TaxID=150288 RepID=UPI0024311D46|nr:uncharacterized protein LOC129411981 [Boleophthalmus pectinirostris]